MRPVLTPFTLAVEHERNLKVGKIEFIFNNAGIMELHAAMHERMNLLIRHIATVLMSPSQIDFRIRTSFNWEATCVRPDV